MNKKNKFPLFIVSLLVLALSMGAMAFSPSPVVNVGSENSGPNGEGGQGGGFRNNENLADALGISVEELQAAFEEARSNAGPDSKFDEALAAALGISVDALESAQDAALAQALAAGDITQEQYDQFVARQALREYFDRDVMVAGALGISIDELQAAQESGQKISDLLTDLGIDPETFQSDVQAAQEAAIADAVADGVITQEQADDIQAGGFRGRGGPGGGRGPAGREGQGGPGSQGPGGPGGAENQVDPGGNNG